LQQICSGADISGSGEADIQAFFTRKSVPPFFSIIVADGEAHIHQRRIPVRRDRAIADTLQHVTRLADRFTGQWSATERLNGSTDGGGAGSFQCLCDPHERAASTDRRNPAINGTSELLEDLGTGRRLMGGDTFRSMELVNVKAITLACD
jgi:hypothetical protein